MIFFREDHIYKDDKQASSTLSGLNICADGIGSFFGPLVSGSITEKLGFEWATTAVGAGYLVMVSEVLCGIKSKRSLEELSLELSKMHTYLAFFVEIRD